MADVPPEVVDCWVLGEDGRRSGLVTAWRWTPRGWYARVVYTVLIDEQWELVEEWLPDRVVELR